MSRIRNAIGNFLTACVTDLTTQILKFVVRTVFIHTLGSEYLGINGLFTNILSMLSLAELGIGAAINFNLYKSLYEKNQKRASQLMKFYKLAYLLIGTIIAIIGLILIPLLPILISDYAKLKPMGINAVLLYCLYLLQTVSSYWFLAYKSSIIRADQKEYIINNVHTVGIIITSLFQIFCLYTFRTLTSYTIVTLVITILQNLWIAIIVKKTYPEIDESKVGWLSKAEVISMIKDCGAVFVYKVNSVIVDATDNIVLSSTIGLSIVGVYSNYLMAVYLIRSVSGKFYNAITAGFGNLHVEGNKEHEYKIFNVINFCTFVMFSVAATWMYCNVHDFIKTWVGEEYLAITFSNGNTLIQTHLNALLAIEMYFFGMYSFLSRIRNSTGIFRDVVISPVLSMIINLIVSLSLAPRMGISGVVVGTIVSGGLTFMWIDPIIICKKVFNTSSKKYFIKNIIYILVTASTCIISFYAINTVHIVGWFGLIIRSVISVLIALIIDFAIFCKTDEFHYLIGIFIGLIRKIISRNQKI